MSSFPIERFVDELFDVTSCYFPISFTPPENDPIGNRCSMPFGTRRVYLFIYLFIYLSTYFFLLLTSLVCISSSLTNISSSILIGAPPDPTAYGRHHADRSCPWPPPLPGCVAALCAVCHRPAAVQTQQRRAGHQGAQTANRVDPSAAGGSRLSVSKYVLLAFVMCSGMEAGMCESR